jgi:hypothetical protein
MTAPATRPARDGEREEPPPFLGKWRRLYLGVIGWLALLILIFYSFAKRFAP